MSSHFRLATCTETEQTRCQTLTACRLEEFQTRAPSLTQDRLCQAATACVAGQEEVNALTATSDRSCRVCPAGKTDADSNPSTPCVACGAGHYVPEGSTGICDNHQCFAGLTDADSNTVTVCVECDGSTEYTDAPGQAGACTTMTVCTAGQSILLDGSTTNDRSCRGCIDFATYSIADNSVRRYFVFAVAVCI